MKKVPKVFFQTSEDSFDVFFQTSEDSFDKAK